MNADSNKGLLIKSNLDKQSFLYWVAKDIQCT